MGWLGVGLALGVPWLAGALWLRLLWREPQPGIWSLALGYGYLIALFGVALSLRTSAALGFPLLPWVPMLLCALLALAGMDRFRRRRHPVPPQKGPARPRGSLWRQLLVLLLLLWIGLRLLGLALEVWWQPLFPWDAWTTWAVRARTWSELGELVPFVSPGDWLADTSGSVHTIAAWRYPETVSLLALWPTLAFGDWNETAANLPWLGCVLALGLGFYGQARLWGASPLTTTVFLWLLLSLPLLDTHVALAGYADLWLATTLGLAFMAFLLWTRDADWRQGVLALLLALACPLIKQEGAVWLLLFVPALLAARLRGLWLLAVTGVAVAAGIALWTMGGLLLDIPGGGTRELTPTRIQLPLLGRFELAYHDSWAAVWRNLFIYDNWHLFAYLLVPAVLWGTRCALRPGAEQWQRAGVLFVLGSLIALFVLFFWTHAYRWAAQSTSINRVFLHFVPAFVFWMLTLWEARATPIVAAPADARSQGPPELQGRPAISLSPGDHTRDKAPPRPSRPG